MRVSFKNLPLVFFTGFALIISASLFVVSTPDFFKQPEVLALGVTADIAIVIPLLFYFFVIRKYKLSAILIVPVLILSVVIASLIIPSANQYYLDFVKQGLVLAELAAVSYGIIKISKVVRAYKEISLAETDFIERLHRAMKKIFGSSIAISIAASEISMMYYSLFFWKSSRELSGKFPYFAYHRKSSYIQLWAVILFVLIIETFAIHALISGWSSVLSFVFLGLSIYTFLFLIADFKAAINRPVVISNDELYLRTGIRFRAIIPLSNIQSVENYKEKFKDKTIINTALSGETNILITFKTSVELQGIYGISKKTNKVSLFIDDAENFKKLISEKI